MKSRTIELEGPTGLITTTTKVTLHPENETRLLSIPINDTPAQTDAILWRLAVDAEDPEGEEDNLWLEPWHALHTWLEGAEHRVVIPFATALADQIPPATVGLRRDFKAVIGLVKAHAILHQATRNRDNDGRIIATLEDYAVVRGLVADLIAEGVEATVPETVAETVWAVEHLVDKTPDGISYTALAQSLHLDKSTAQRRARVALHRGYLKKEETKRGHPAKLVIGDPLPPELPILPPAEAIQAESVVMVGCSVAGNSGREVPPSSSSGDRENFDL